MPPLFITMLTMLGIDIFSKKEETTSPLALGSMGSNYSNFMPDLTIAKVIKEFESGLKTKSNAYPDNEGVPTIGNGSTIIVNNVGKVIRKVRLGDTLQLIKSLTNNTHLNDEDMAYKLTMNHITFLSKDVYLSIAKDLDFNNVPFSQNVATYLYENAYGSGDLGKSYVKAKQFYKTMIFKMKNSKNDTDRISALLEFRLRYYQSLTNWNGNKKGWTRRIITSARFYNREFNLSQINFEHNSYFLKSGPFDRLKIISHFKTKFGIDNVGV